MKKTILLSLMVIVLNIMYAQQGEIIYTEFNPYQCMTGLPSEQTITLDINHDGVDETLFYRCFGGHNGDPWDILYDPTDNPDKDKWKYRDLNYEHTDTLSMVAHYGHYYYYSIWGSIYNYHSAAYEVTKTLRIAVRHTVEDDPNGETHYCYGWIEVVGKWTWEPSTWTARLTVWVPRMAYCTIPDYPLVYGQISVDGVFAGTEDVPVKVYPNPTSDYVKIEVYHSYQHIAVYSIDGRLLFETQDATAQPATINVANLKSGVYIIKVKLTDGNDYVAKIVKE
jgi:hypothetical protein